MAKTRLSTARQPLKVKTPSRPAANIGDGNGLPHSPSVLLLVDFINPLEFPKAGALADAALPAARATARLKRRLVESGTLCIYANDNYGRWRSDFRQTLDYCLSREGAAGAIARLLAPAESDLVILKPRHSAFYQTPLELVLGQTRTRQLIIAGLATDICVQLTAMDAGLRGYEVHVPADCTAAESPESRQQALRYLKRVLKADVRASAAVAANARESMPNRHQ
jgi:nicotinamidase-related amidase